MKTRNLILVVLFTLSLGGCGDNPQAILRSGGLPTNNHRIYTFYRMNIDKIGASPSWSVANFCPIHLPHQCFKLDYLGDLAAYTPFHDEVNIRVKDGQILHIGKVWRLTNFDYRIADLFFGPYAAIFVGRYIVLPLPLLLIVLLGIAVIRRRSRLRRSCLSR